jgi:hypothetical protein
MRVVWQADGLTDTPTLAVVEVLDGWWQLGGGGLRVLCV